MLEPQSAMFVALLTMCCVMSQELQTVTLDGVREDLTTVTRAFIEEQRRPGAQPINDVLQTALSMLHNPLGFLPFWLMERANISASLEPQLLQRGMASGRQ